MTVKLRLLKENSKFFGMLSFAGRKKEERRVMIHGRERGLWKEHVKIQNSFQGVSDSSFHRILHRSLTSSLDLAATAKSLQSCPTLCDPIDGSPPGTPVPGILQARTLEWVAISFSNA